MFKRFVIVHTRVVYTVKVELGAEPGMTNFLFFPRHPSLSFKKVGCADPPSPF